MCAESYKKVKSQMLTFGERKRKSEQEDQKIKGLNTNNVVDKHMQRYYYETNYTLHKLNK